MFKKMKSAIQSAFQQAADAQAEIDASARRVVESIQRMVDVSLEEVPSSRAALAGHDFTWYEETAHMLGAAGFDAPKAFEPAGALSRPVESRTLSESALGDSGTVVATWFLMRGTDKRPERRIVAFRSVSEDGHRFEIVQNGTPNDLPVPPTTHVEHVGPDLSLLEVLQRHRDRVQAHGAPLRRFPTLAAAQVDSIQAGARVASFRRRQGLGLIERFLAKRFQGDKQEVGEAYIAAIRAHPEWYAYARGDGSTSEEKPDEKEVASPPPAESPAPAMPLGFLMSAADDGRRTLTTFGMLFAGLPELMLTDVAPNHARAGRFILGTVSRAIARRRSELPSDAAFVAELVSDSGARLMLTAADAVPGEAAAPSDAAVPVHLALRGFAGTTDDDPSLLGVDPLPGGAQSMDERLRAACRQLGCDAPAATSDDSLDAAMLAAHARAISLLPDIKERFQSGFPAGTRLCVKIRATEGETGEYVWLQVNRWESRELSTMVLTPAPRVGLESGQELAIDEGRIFDHLIAGPEGILLPSLTDQVAVDYGLDI